MIEKLKIIAELIVFKHSVFALPFIFVAMIVASKIESGSAWFGLLFALLVLEILLWLLIDIKMKISIS